MIWLVLLYIPVLLMVVIITASSEKGVELIQVQLPTRKMKTHPDGYFLMMQKLRLLILAKSLQNVLVVK